VAGSLSGLYPGTIKEAPTGPAASDTISYTVVAKMPSGSSVTFPNAKPAQLRLDPSADTVPARVGDPCIVYILGKLVYFFIFEQPSTGECAP